MPWVLAVKCVLIALLGKGKQVNKGLPAIVLKMDCLAFHRRVPEDPIYLAASVARVRVNRYCLPPPLWSLRKEPLALKSPSRNSVENANVA